MKRKLLFALLAAMLALSCALVLSACGFGGGNGGGNGDGEHEHVYEDIYSYDETHHWHAAVCCPDVRKDYEEHTFTDGEGARVCLKCGYESAYERFTLTLDAGEGTLSGEASCQVTMGSSYRLAVPALPGHAFLGWYIGDVQITDAEGNSLQAWNYDGDRIATAKYEIASYSVLYLDEHGFVWSVNGRGGVTVRYGESFALDVPEARLGYTFAGWYLGDTQLTDEAGASLSAFTYGEDVYVTPKWQVNRYAVSFSGEEHGLAVIVYEGESSEGGSYPYRARLTVRLRPDEGYSFGGISFSDDRLNIISWELQPDGTREGTFTLLEKDVSIAVNWVGNTYYATMADLDGGSLPGDSTRKVTFGEEFSLDVPAKTGYSFLGWYVGEERVTDAQGSSLCAWKWLQDTSLRARWSANTYSVTCDAPESALHGESMRVTFDEDFALPVPSREHYDFAGWFVGDTQVTDGEGNSLSPWKYGEDKAVTAAWQIHSNALSLSKEIDSCEANGSAFYEYGSTATAEAVTYLGYTFLGWFEGDVRVSEEEVYSFPMPDREVYLMAKWEISDELLLPFTFTSTLSSLKITGVLDKEAMTIHIPEIATGIAPSAFAGCAQVRTLVLPQIGESFPTLSSLFGGAVPSVLGEVVVTAAETIGRDAFRDCASLVRAVIYEGCTRIAESAFNGCTSLREVELPQTLQWIAQAAFYGCTSLAAIEFPDAVLGFGTQVFSGCTALSSVKLPPQITGIAARLFDGCTSLSSVEIPYGVRSIGENAFRDCAALTHIVVPDSVTTAVSNGVFRGCPLVEASVPASVAVFDGIDTLKKVTVTSGTQLRYEAFARCGALEEILLPDTLQDIGRNAFSGCSSLRSLIIPDSVTSLGWAPFSGCTALESVTMPALWVSAETQTSFWRLFGSMESDYEEDAVALKTVIVTGGEISDRAFENCKYIEEIDLRCGGTSIGAYAFSGCTSLRSVILPDSVLSLGVRAFAGCTSLRAIDLPDGIEAIPEAAFVGCNSLSQIGWPGSLKAIGDRAFIDCSAIRALLLPDSLLTIGQSAFLGCDYLRVVRLGRGLESIGESAFYSTNLAVVLNATAEQPDGLNEVYDFVRKVYTLSERDSCEVQGDFLFATIGGENILVRYIGRGAQCTLPAQYNGEDYTVGSYSFYFYAFSGNTQPSSVILTKGIAKIERDVFDGCTANVFYTGSTEDWKEGNYSSISGAYKIYYFSAAQPSGTGNFWHWAEDGVTPVIWGSESA